MEKLLIALAAIVGGILFVIAMLGFLCLVAYLLVIAFVVGVAFAIVAGLIKLAQAKIRLVVAYSFFGTIFIVGTLWLCFAGRTAQAVVGGFIGLLVALLMHFKSKELYGKVTADPAAQHSYTDKDGNEHQYVVVGYEQLPEPLAERPFVFLLLVIGLFIAVLLILYAVPRHIESPVDRLMNVWAFGFGILSVISVSALYSVIEAEQQADVEIFGQSLPDDFTSEALTTVETYCPQPMQWTKSLWSDVCEACGYVKDVAIRWGT